MANMERLSLMQNQLNLLKTKSRKNNSINFGARQQIISCISHPEFSDESHRLMSGGGGGDSLNY